MDSASAPATTIEALLQQLVEAQNRTTVSLQDLSNQSLAVNLRLDQLSEKVQALEATEPYSEFVLEEKVEGSNPLDTGNKRPDPVSKASTPTSSIADDKSSEAILGTKEDLAFPDCTTRLWASLSDQAASRS